MRKNPSINLYHGDCMEAMNDMKENQYDLAIVDPPYGIERDKGFGGFCGFCGFGKPINRKKYNGNWDNKTPEKKYFEKLLNISRNVLIFGGNFFTDKLPKSNHWIFWDKLNTMPSFGDGELIYTNIKRNSVKKITQEYNGLIGKEKNRFHATQKPVILYKKLIKLYAKQGNKILDTHGGSMSIAIACWDLGFDLDLWELDEDYYKAGVERFENHKRQGLLF